jgi:hypothetical protein
MTNFTGLGSLDPAVNLLIDQGDRRQTEAHLPKGERTRKKKDRERAQRRKPNRINLDLPQDLKRRLEILAKRRFQSASWLPSCSTNQSISWRAGRSVCGVIKLLWLPKFECNLDLRSALRWREKLKSGLYRAS